MSYNFDDKDLAIICLSLVAIITIISIMKFGSSDNIDKFIIILSTIIGAISGIATGRKAGE
jgi:hypothetical protein